MLQGKFLTAVVPVPAVKRLGKFNKKTGIYTIPNLARQRKELEANRASFSSETVAEWKDFEHKTYPLLYGYQKEAVQAIVNSPYEGMMLFLSPGLGKSIISIVAGETSPLLWEKNLIICPASLKYVWEDELEKWSEKNPNITWTIVSYESYRSPKFQTANPGPWDFVVLDESLKIKNRKALRTEFLFKNLDAQKVVLLSGNPISRYYDDLWSQIRHTFPEAFTSYWRFAEEYTYVDREAGTYAITGNRPMDPVLDMPELIFRRNHEQVLPDLPDFIYRHVNLDLTHEQQRLYDKMEEDFELTLEHSGVELSMSNKVAQLVRLRQVTSCVANLPGLEGTFDSSKHDYIIDQIEDQAVALPAIIWVHFIEGGKVLAQKLRRTFPELRVGFASGIDKSDIERYKNWEVDILILSLGVGKYGHTFTQTREMIYLEKDFDPDAIFQSEHRVRRIGLTHKPIVTTLHCPRTTDDLVRENLEGKMPGIATLSNSDILKALRGLRQ